MSKIGANTPGHLSFDQKLGLAKALWPIGDRVHELADAMKAHGFSAFVPYGEWIESFARDPQELESHRQYQRAWAKYSLGLALLEVDSDLYRDLGAPPPLRKRPAATREWDDYEHQLLLLSDEEIHWHIEDDPCRARIQNDAEWAASGRLNDERNGRLRAETVAHATELSKRYSMLMMIVRDRIAFSKAALNRELEPLGFRWDRRRSTFIAPVLSKRVAARWDLCFELIPDRIFGDAGSGFFDSRLSLRPNRDRATFDPSRHLRIPYLSVPGAFGVYSHFRSIAELDNIIQARTCLYSLMAPELEARLRDYLDGLPPRPAA